MATSDTPFGQRKFRPVEEPSQRISPTYIGICLCDTDLLLRYFRYYHHIGIPSELGSIIFQSGYHGFTVFGAILIALGVRQKEYFSVTLYCTKRTNNDSPFLPDLECV